MQKTHLCLSSSILTRKTVHNLLDSFTFGAALVQMFIVQVWRFQLHRNPPTRLQRTVSVDGEKTQESHSWGNNFILPQLCEWNKTNSAVSKGTERKQQFSKKKKNKQALSHIDYIAHHLGRMHQGKRKKVQIVIRDERGENIYTRWYVCECTFWYFEMMNLKLLSRLVASDSLHVVLANSVQSDRIE